MLVKRWMTKNVITIKKGQTLKQAAALMWQHQIRFLPVLDGAKFVGMLSDRDLLSIDPRHPDSDIFQDQPMLEQFKVEERMSRKVPYVSPETNFEALVNIMLNKKVTAVPVLEGGQLVGIVCDDDMFRAFVEITGLKEQGLRFSLKMKRSENPMGRIAEILDKFNDAILGILTFKIPDAPEFLRIVFQVKPSDAPEMLRFFETEGYQTDNVMKLLQNALAN